MSQRTELLRTAEDLEKMAKNEEIDFVELFDLKGKRKMIHRYELPHMAEGLRIQAQFCD